MKKLDIKVLYVEDEKILRSIYTKILSDWINKLYVGENGEEGYNLYKKYKPDLIITDIKMPVMSGLEMVRKIKAKDQNIKIVIMSAYGQTEYFMQAINYGVQGFLLKPVDNKQLFSLINELAQAAILEKRVKYQEVQRRKAEKALKRGEAILKAVNFASEQFLKINYGGETIKKVLQRLGEASKVSRVYVFENNIYNNKITTSQKFEWVAKNIKPEIDNPELQNFSPSENGFERWINVLSKGDPINGLIEDFPESEQAVLFAQNILSIVVVPIFVDKFWWGFIGFDDCKTKRTWTSAELKALNTAADIFGAAIHRGEVEEKLRKLNAELEKRVEERTEDLQNEISEHICTEIKLRESEENYRQIFENANDGILLTVNGIINFINPKIYEITGFMPKEAISKPFIDFIHPDYRELVLTNHKKRLKGEKVIDRYDIKAFDKKGNEKWYEIKSNVTSWEGEPAVLTFLTDITTRKKTAEELKELNKHLEKRVKEELKKIEFQQQLLIQKSKLESLGELAAGIAHEINQPLVGISMGLDNILIKSKNNEVTEDYLNTKFNKLFEDIERIRKIINHIRVFSRDQDLTDFKKVNINEVINNALSMVKTQYKNHNVKCTISLNCKDCYTYGNKYKLEQVILNILSNAKYAIDEKENTINDISYQKQIKIKTYENRNNLFINIEDNGIGILENDLIKIFDPFFTTKKSEVGTGLGLSITYGILKEMKGDINVETKLNEHTIMKISLPKTV